MAFTGPNESTPYYRPIAPEVPQPDNTAAKIISAGTGPAISGFVHMAIAREQAQLEQQAILQRADIAANQLAFQREHMQDAHSLAVRGQDIQNRNVSLDYDIANRRLDLQSEMDQHQADHVDALTGLAKQQTNYYGSALTRTVQSAQKRAQFVEEAGKDANELGLENLDFQGKNPMQYAKNALGFEKIYGGSIDPFIKNKVEQYVKSAQSSKVSLPDDTGKMVQYPWSQVVQDIERDSNSPFIERLRRANLFHTERSEETVTNAFGVNVPKQTTRTPKGDLKRMLEDTKRGTPIKEIDAFKPKADPFADTSEAIMNKPIPGRKGVSAAGMLSKGAELPPPEKSSAETEADFVKQKIAADPTNAQFYRARYLERNPGNESLIQ